MVDRFSTRTYSAAKFEAQAVQEVIVVYNRN
jgi:hypothetical protein